MNGSYRLVPEVQDPDLDSFRQEQPGDNVSPGCQVLLQVISVKLFSCRWQARFR